MASRARSSGRDAPCRADPRQGLKTSANRMQETLNGIAVVALRPPKAASGQRRSSTSGTAPRPLPRRSCGRRFAPVVALVVVPVVPRVVILVAVEIDAVQHHANRSRLAGAYGLERAF